MPQTSENRDIYLSQVHQLKQLQKVDDIIYDEKKVLEQAPKDLKELEDRFARVEQQRNHIQEKLAHLREQEMRVKRETEEENERLRKSRDKLMASGNEREYNAVTREIDAMEKMALPREDERVRMLDELKTQTALFEENEQEYVDLRTQVESRRVSMEETLRKAGARLRQLDRDRVACSRAIPKPIFQRYEFIRERLEHPVIVALKDCICPSCHIAVPPQTYNDLLRGGQIMSCPNCQRLIVSYEDYIADDPEEQARAAAERESMGSRSGHKKTAAGRSAALERDYKDEKEDVEFGSTPDDLDDELHMGSSIDSELKLSNMSRMADVSDLAEMSETTGLGEIGADGEDSDKND